jgi:hypothetical protein
VLAVAFALVCDGALVAVRRLAVPWARFTT